MLVEGLLGHGAVFPHQATQTLTDHAATLLRHEVYALLHEGTVCQWATVGQARSIEAAVEHIVRVDPAFQRVVQAVGPVDPRRPDGDSFTTLARSIVFQQLAGAAARAIYGRFIALYDGRATAEAVLRTPMEQLRAVGLSGSKAASIVDLAAKTSDGTVLLDHLDELPDAEIVRRLSAVRGIGRWTAQMFLNFHLRRLDVWPADDHGVRKGFAVIHALPAPPAPKAFEALGDIYRPYRSVAAWYCWRAVDTVLPT